MMGNDEVVVGFQDLVKKFQNFALEQGHYLVKFDLLDLDDGGRIVYERPEIEVDKLFIERFRPTVFEMPAHFREKIKKQLPSKWKEIVHGKSN